MVVSRITCVYVYAYYANVNNSCLLIQLLIVLYIIYIIYN